MDFGEIKSKALAMGEKVQNMLSLVERGFLENKPEHLTKAIAEEKAINGLEKELTAAILALSRSSKEEKEKRGMSALAQMIETFERMGDEAASLVERVEIKISERLLFSDMGVEQFRETYNTMKRSVEMMLEFVKNGDSAVKERVIDNGFHVKELVERYRKEHADRLVKGLCTPMAANMYFDMLDFTGNLARHSSNIVKLALL